jgi:hypothetical protein
MLTCAYHALLYRVYLSPRGHRRVPTGDWSASLLPLLSDIHYLIDPTATAVPLGFQPDTVNATPGTPLVENAPGLPFGITFMGTAFSEFQLIQYAYAYEQATHNRLKRLAYPGAIPPTQLVDIIEMGY